MMYKVHWTTIYHFRNLCERWGVASLDENVQVSTAHSAFRIAI